MTQGTIEHLNLSVSDPDRSVALLEKLLRWQVRWRGPAASGGETVHVGEERTYLALWSDGQPRGPQPRGAPLNHIGLLVDDLAAAEAVVREAGLGTFWHGEYEPGRRFYFTDWDGIEFEVVSYT